MATPVKVRQQKKSTSKHKCTKEDTILRQGILIERIGKVTLGNGTPEDGLLFQFRVFMEDHKTVVQNINDLKIKVEQSLKDSETTRHVFELYKTQKEGTELGEKEIIEKKNIEENRRRTISRDNWQKVMWIVMGVIGIASIWLSIYLNNRNASTVENKVDNLGDPVVTNPRGELVPLPEGFSLKMWPNDFDEKITDTIK